MMENVENTPEVLDMNKEWQNYLQKCCEAGQLWHALQQLGSQTLEIEKKLEITQRELKAASRKHSEIQQAQRAKAQAQVVQPEAQGH